MKIHVAAVLKNYRWCHCKSRIKPSNQLWYYQQEPKNYQNLDLVAKSA